ncbi:hypothetical protein BGZ74_008510 [Mortierella antarctica]|nr:hypothetical protein BGZ74_008510 [Mortierella antarctica]
MSAPVSIFDITLIVDSICQSLILHDIQTCRQVNKHWSSMFKPHLWSHPKLPATTTLTDDRVATLLAHKRWIRSMTLAANHIEKISALGFTHFQELILYDQNFECSYEGASVSLNAIVSLLDNNPALRSREIDLNRYHYQDCDQPRELSLALMLAIARHPSLTHLVWHVVDGHANSDFAQCLLYVCQQRPIQELYVLQKEHIHPYCGICDGNCSLADNYCRSFSCSDEAFLERLPELRALKQKLEEASMEQLLSERPLAFRKLQLPFEFEGCYLPMLKNCPDLQEVSVDLAGEQGDEVLEVLAGCPTLWGFDLRCGRYDMDCARGVQRFTQLQTVRFPQMPKEMLQGVFDSLRRSSHETLEVLGLNMSVSPEDVVHVQQSFPNLNEIDLTTVRIYIQDNCRFPSGCYVPDAEDCTVDDCIVRHWDESQLYRPDETTSEWWDHWTKAKRFMQAMSSVYVQQRHKHVLQPMFMRFMYPIKAFMSQVEVFAYAEGTGVWANSMGRALTVADAKRMVDAQHEEVERRNEWQREWRRERQSSKYGADSVWEEAQRYQFNEYDEAEADEPAREYVIAKSRNRHHSLRGKKPSPFRRPFKK